MSCPSKCSNCGAPADTSPRCRYCEAPRLPARVSSRCPTFIIRQDFGNVDPERVARAFERRLRESVALALPPGTDGRYLDPEG